MRVSDDHRMGGPVTRSRSLVFARPSFGSEWINDAVFRKPAAVARSKRLTSAGYGLLLLSGPASVDVPRKACPSVPVNFRGVPGGLLDGWGFRARNRRGHAPSS